MIDDATALCLRARRGDHGGLRPLNVRVWRALTNTTLAAAGRHERVSAMASSVVYRSASSPIQERRRPDGGYRPREGRQPNNGPKRSHMGVGHSYRPTPQIERCSPNAHSQATGEPSFVNAAPVRPSLPIALRLKEKPRHLGDPTRFDETGPHSPLRGLRCRRVMGRNSGLLSV